MDHFIRDGYDEPGFIAELQGLRPALKFSYRPMLVEERDTIERAKNGKGLKEAHAIMRRAMAKHVVSWQLDAPCKDESSYRTLRPSLFDALWSIITGDRPSDLDNDAAAKVQAEQIDTELEALGLGVAPADVKAGADSKN